MYGSKSVEVTHKQSPTPVGCAWFNDDSDRSHFIIRIIVINQHSYSIYNGLLMSMISAELNWMLDILCTI